jgi:eukaryotic-like serine/threonine-protein kinase
MTIPSGTRLGPYDIQAPLGAGGMGEVYRARDTRLDRIVAIKVLPTDLSRSPEARQRLEREARAISALSHPHICTLYDVGHQDGVDYLVMEYLEGETLEERLRKGALPLNQVLRYGVEIADALSKAHAKGIVHRDLKPGNIMLTRSGAKLLDFGLARVMKQPAPVVSGLPGLTTETMRLTGEGVIVGTWQYMAPEQLEGGEADARTDIFALGTVLYEMATGRAAFSGKTQASLIAAILSSHPPAIASLQSMSPPALDHAVRKCLEKDPQERWQSAHDLKVELQWIAELPPEGGGLPAQATLPRFGRGLVLATAALALIALVGMGLAYWRTTHTAPPAVVRFSITPPESTLFDDTPPPLISPNGRILAFCAQGADQQRKIWVRPLDSQTAQPLPGTVCNFTWSPDSRYIGFFAEGKLKRIEISGLIPEDLCTVGSAFLPTWNQYGILLFAGPNMPIQQINLADCAIKLATRLDSSRGEERHLFPRFLPDGRNFLWVAVSRSGEKDIYIGSLGSEMGRLLINNGSTPSYVPPGYLVFAREGKLLAVALDSRHLRTTGETFPVVREQVEFGNDSGWTRYSVSQNGVLVYRPGESITANKQLQWLNRAGKQVGLIAEPSLYQNVQLSPDGERIAVSRIDRLSHTGDIWIYGINRKTWTRFTFNSISGGGVASWSPDGQRIAYGFGDRELPQLYVKRADGSAPEEALLQVKDEPFPDCWSPDGRYLVYETSNRKTGSDLWVLPLFGDRKPIPFSQTQFNETAGTISPDGHWIAYESDESGRWEVYVRPFPGPGRRWQISSGGAAGSPPYWRLEPKWRKDGKELFYVSADWKLMSVPVRLGATFEMGTPTPLFPLRKDSEYDVSGDGRRFLVLAEDQNQPPPLIKVVLNWTSELQHLQQ